MNRGFPLHLKTMFFLDLGFRSVADEQRFPSPLEDHVLSLRYVRKIDLDLGQGQHIGGRRPICDEFVNEGGGGISACSPHCSDHEIIESLSICPGVLALRRWILRGLPSIMSEVWHRHVP